MKTSGRMPAFEQMNYLFELCYKCMLYNTNICYLNINFNCYWIFNITLTLYDSCMRAVCVIQTVQ